MTVQADRSTVSQIRSPSLRRWECTCDGQSEPPVLLAMVEPGVRIVVKVRDRWYVVTDGTVVAICPKCGTEHELQVGATISAT